ncbi:MAG: hypothetical protein EOO14_08865 [Chitinophagaceae bacterium]|nr:MAG: hypothetical protein EOO14_08865 [Chitinophagaceae bacterium]
MKQEFVTTTGLVSIEQGLVRFERKVLSMNYQLLAEIGLPIFFVLRFFSLLEKDTSPMKNIGLLIYGILSLMGIISLLYTVFKRSFSNQIFVQNIRSYRVQEQANGLEVQLTLILKSGRERIVTFRKLENQVEPFVNALSSANTSIDLA